jgi:hypothetical protein
MFGKLQLWILGHTLRKISFSNYDSTTYPTILHIQRGKLLGEKKLGPLIVVATYFPTSQKSHCAENIVMYRSYVCSPIRRALPSTHRISANTHPKPSCASSAKSRCHITSPACSHSRPSQSLMISHACPVYAFHVDPSHPPSPPNNPPN